VTVTYVTNATTSGKVDVTTENSKDGNVTGIPTLPKLDIPAPAGKDGASGGLDGGSIIGIVLGSLIVTALIILGLRYCYIKKHHQGGK
jgi:hypothetical protein